MTPRERTTQNAPRDDRDTGKTPRHRPLIGKTIGDCCVVSWLGGGGMGEVYLAEQTVGTGTRQVALKTILPEKIDDRLIKRFKEEAAAAGTLNTPYVIKVFQSGHIELPDAGTDRPVHYLVMEYADGGTLVDYMRSFDDDLMPVAEATRLLRQAAQGLLAAERHVKKDGEPAPIYHRDIKPQNLLLTRHQQRHGTVLDMRIADFGSAKRAEGDHVTQDMAPMSPGFASPEQWSWEIVDHRSDMYSLGATFYYVLTGKCAFPDTEELAKIREFALRTPCLDPKAVRNDVPDALNRIIQRMTRRKKKERFASFAEVVGELEALEEPQSSRTLLWAAGAALVTTLAFVGLEASGVTHVLRSERIVEGTTLQDRHDAYAKLLGNADALAGAAIPNVDPSAKWIAEASGGITEVRGRIASALAEIDRAINEHGPDDRQSVVTAEAAALLEANLGEAAQFRERSRVCAAELEELEASLSGDISVEAARDQHGVARVPEVFFVCRSLESKWEHIRTEIDGIAAARRAELSASRAAFERAEVDLTALKGDVTAYAERMERLDESELAAAATKLTESIDAAHTIEQQIPAWPPTAAKPVEALDRLPVAVHEVDAIACDSSDQALAAWWDARRHQSGDDWLRDLLPILGRASQELVQRILDSPDSASQELESESDSYLRLLQTLRKTARSSGVFSERSAPTLLENIETYVTLEGQAGQLREARADFRAARRELDRLETSVDKTKGWRPSLAGPAEALEASIRAAREIEDKLPDWPGTAAGSDALAQLPSVWTRVDHIVPGGSSDLGAWWTSRRSQLWTTWARHAAGLLEERDVDVQASTLAELVELAARVGEQEELQDASGMVASALDKRHQLLQKKPTGWPDEAWRLWPQKYEIPNGLLGRADGNGLICWFEKRVDGRGQPVEMVLVRTPVPFLVDIHEVTLGELLAVRNEDLAKDYGEYFRQHARVIRKYAGEPETLVFLTSHKVAKQFAETAYPDLGLALPARAQWDAMQRFTGAEDPEIQSMPPRRGQNAWDVSRDGVRGLRTGLSEWCTDENHSGGTTYKSDKGDAGVFRRAVGFRCTRNLVPR